MGTFRSVQRVQGRVMRVRLTAALALVMLGVSCTGSRAEDASSSPTPATGPISPSATATPPAQPATDYSTFTHALEAAGFAVREGKLAPGDPFQEPARILFIDGVEVRTMEYPSQKALDGSRASISRDGYSIPTKSGGIAMVEWIAPPHFYGAGKLLVLYLGDKQSTLDALELILGPQFAGS